MPEISFSVVKKPIEERIVDAACVYWNVERSYFFDKCSKSESVYRKSCLYFLIKEHTSCSLKEIASKFGYSSHSPICRSIDEIDARRRNLRQISNDLSEVLKIADILDASLVCVSMRIVNNVVELNS